MSLKIERVFALIAVVMVKEERLELSHQKRNAGTLFFRKVPNVSCASISPAKT